MNLLLKGHALADLLGLILLGHVVRLVQGNLFLLAVHKDAAPLIDIVSGKAHTSPSHLAIHHAGARKGPHKGNLDGITRGIDPVGRIPTGHIAHLAGIKFCVRLGPGFR